MQRRARDVELLDALDACERTEFEGLAWRVVRDGRDPLQGYQSSARWDPGTFEVLYTSLERDGALAEIHFHLSRQPVFPSKLQSTLYRIRVRTRRALRLADFDALRPLGVDRDRYAELDFPRTQEIGDAAQFLGFDSLIVPSARWNCLNLVLFTDRLEPTDLDIEHREKVDWSAWRRRTSGRRRTPT